MTEIERQRRVHADNGVRDQSDAESRAEALLSATYDGRRLLGGSMLGVAQVRRLLVAAATREPIVPDDAMVEKFKSEWHRADAEGDRGNRVRRALKAALSQDRQDQGR